MINNFCCILVGVHDSYWTHACDVDDMNRILRGKFVKLYETPILENVWFKCSFFISHAVVFLQGIIFEAK